MTLVLKISSTFEAQKCKIVSCGQATFQNLQISHLMICWRQSFFEAMSFFFLAAGSACSGLWSLSAIPSGTIFSLGLSFDHEITEGVVLSSISLE